MVTESSTNSHELSSGSPSWSSGPSSASSSSGIRPEVQIWEGPGILPNLHATCLVCHNFIHILTEGHKTPGQRQGRVITHSKNNKHSSILCITRIHTGPGTRGQMLPIRASTCSGLHAPQDPKIKSLRTFMRLRTYLLVLLSEKQDYSLPRNVSKYF